MERNEECAMQNIEIERLLRNVSSRKIREKTVRQNFKIISKYSFTLLILSEDNKFYYFIDFFQFFNVFWWQ